MPRTYLTISIVLDHSLTQHHERRRLNYCGPLVSIAERLCELVRSAWHMHMRIDKRIIRSLIPHIHQDFVWKAYRMTCSKFSLFGFIMFRIILCRENYVYYIFPTHKYIVVVNIILFMKIMKINIYLHSSVAH